jgi:uncharacterized coiled-coil DUF342 family protein
MQERMRQRAADLKEEFVKGQRRLEMLEAEANQLRQTLMRISGAIQVLEEALAEEASEKTAG